MNIIAPLNNNNKVDWWIIMVNKNKKYLYCDNSNKKFKEYNNINNSALMNTTAQINQNTNYIIYNDSHNFKKTYDRSKGHMKGIICYNDRGGFVIQHSLPNWPILLSDLSRIKKISNHQYFFCFSLSYENINKYGKFLLDLNPNIYLYNFNTVNNIYHKLVYQNNSITNNFFKNKIFLDNNEFLTIKTRDNKTLTLISKKNQTQDIYDYLKYLYQTNIYIYANWYTDFINSIKDINIITNHNINSKDGNIYGFKNFKFNDYTFKNEYTCKQYKDSFECQNDHMKIAGFKNNILFSDLNHHQFFRRGGAVIMEDDEVSKQFKNYSYNKIKLSDNQYYVRSKRMVNPRYIILIILIIILTFCYFYSF